MMTPIEKQKLEVLNGDRGPVEQHAMRMAAAMALVNNLPVDPTGDPAKDIKALYAALNAMRIALQ
jgi:hypothetical protein